LKTGIGSGSSTGTWELRIKISTLDTEYFTWCLRPSLDRPIGTSVAATLTQAGGPLDTGWSFQLVPKGFPPFFEILFYFNHLLLFMLSTRT
jgi:hypothetical protein